SYALAIPPAIVILEATSSSLLLRRAANASLAPLEASNCAASAPRPVPPPVIRTTLPLILSFICISSLQLVIGGLSGDRRGRRFCNGNILLHRTGACSYGSDELPIAKNGNAAAKDHHFAFVAFLNAKKRLPGLCELRQVRSCLVEQSRRFGFLDRQIDAANER